MCQDCSRLRRPWWSKSLAMSTAVRSPIFSIGSAPAAISTSTTCLCPAHRSTHQMWTKRLSFLSVFYSIVQCPIGYFSQWQTGVPLTGCHSHASQLTNWFQCNNRMSIDICYCCCWQWWPVLIFGVLLCPYANTVRAHIEAEERQKKKRKWRRRWRNTTKTIQTNKEPKKVDGQINGQFSGSS